MLFEFVIALVYLFLLITGFPPSLPVLPTFIISIWFQEKKPKHIFPMCVLKWDVDKGRYKVIIAPLAKHHQVIPLRRWWMLKKELHQGEHCLGFTYYLLSTAVATSQWLVSHQPNCLLIFLCIHTHVRTHARAHTHLSHVFSHLLKE